MRKLIFVFLPLLFLLAIPSDANAEKLIFSGSGEIQNDYMIKNSDFHAVFEMTGNERRPVFGFESGFILVDNERYTITHSEIRDIRNHEMFRMSGTLDNVGVFWIYGIKEDHNHEMFGKIRIDSKTSYEVQYDGKTTNKSVSNTLKNTPKMNFDYFMESPVFIQNEITVQVKAFDSAKTVGGMRNTLHNLGNVHMKVDLEQNKKELVVVDEINSFEKIIDDEWKTIRSFEGITNGNGDWIGSKLLTDGIFEPNQPMRVTITATFDGQTVMKQTEVFVSEFLY